MKRINGFISLIVCAIMIGLFCSFEILKDTEYYYGELKIKKNYTYYDKDYSFTNYMAYANLYNDSVNFSQSWKANNFGTVYYNDVPLSYNSFIRTYTDTVQRRANTGINWSIYNSLSTITSNVNIVDSFPKININCLLIDKLNKSQDLQIDLSTVVYADEIEITMYDGQFRTQVPFYRKIKSGPSSLVIPATDLSTLTGENVTITISLIKKEFRIMDGKKYKFETIYNCIRPMKIVQTND